MNTTAKIFLAFIAGAATGAALGVLFAPGKGSETRKKLSEEGKKIADNVKNKLQEVKDKMACEKEPLEV